MYRNKMKFQVNKGKMHANQTLVFYFEAMRKRDASEKRAKKKKPSTFD